MRSIPDPGFRDDDGAADPELVAVLAAYERSAADAAAGITEEDTSADAHLAVLAVLQDTRVLVPVVAVLGEVEYDDQGRVHDKTSDMAAVLMTGRDGRTALLAFTGTTSLLRWDPAARPVPVTLQQAAQAASQDGAAALVLDVAGPVLCVIEDDELRAFARGHRLVRLEGSSWGWAAPG